MERGTEETFVLSLLRRLQIRCTSLDSSPTDFVHQVLLSVQWPTLQSLVLSGSAVNEWTQILAAITVDNTTMDVFLHDFRLQHLGICGLIGKQIHLSHSSMFSVHRLVYANQCMDLVLENAYPGDCRDSDLIARNLLPSGNT